MSTSDQKDFLKNIYQSLSDRPLDPDDPFYEPIYNRAGCDDPIDTMQKHIEWNDLESIQMLSGFRGAGKTSELRRLQQNLEAAGYIVLYGDALDYLNPAGEIDISDLLTVLAGTFSEALEQNQFGGTNDSFWLRLKNYLVTTKVELDEVGANIGVNLKLKLKTSPTFRQHFQEKLSYRIGELKQQVDAFFEEGIKAIRKSKGETIKGVVFIFDQLEQIRGSLSNEHSVISSVERLFSQHSKLLEIPYMHMVYTVPPWLKFVMPNVGRIELLPSIRQWDNDDSRSPYEPGQSVLRSLVQRRFGDLGLERFFGSKDLTNPLLNSIITTCGGHFRDLLLLLRETVLRVKALPVTPEVINTAIAAVRNNFLPIAADDARWLREISHIRDTALPSTKVLDVNRLTRFLDTHFVLYFSNGDDWYDIHPLIRDEVESIVAREPTPS